LDPGFRCAGVSDAVVVAVRTNDVVTPVVEVMVTGLTEKAVLRKVPVSVLTVKLTGPVKPLNGVIVSTIAEAALPVVTVLLAVQGVIEKSRWVAEITSMGVTMPVLLEFESSEPFELAKVVSPE